MLRRLLILLLCLLPTAAAAQPGPLDPKDTWFPWFLPGGGGSNGKIIRSYHLDRSGLGSSNLCATSIGCPTLGVYFDDAVAATYVPEIGGAPLTLTVNGNPTRVPAGTWPAGFAAAPGYAWRMDGTGDYLSIADNPLFEVPDFSVFACMIPRGVATGDGYAGKSVFGQIGWIIYTPTEATRIQLGVSDDGSAGGGHFSALTKTSATAANRITCYTVSYDYIADGSSVGNIWVDELAVATSNTMDGPPFNGNGPLEINTYNAPGQEPPVDMLVWAYYPGVLTAADHLKLSRRYRGLYDGSGTQVVSVVNAAPPSLQVAAPADAVEPFLVDQPANTTQLGKTASCSGLYGPSAVSNLVQYGSVEAWAAGAPTGWTEGITSTGDCAQGLTRMAHGSSAARCTLADADDAVTLTSACLTVVGSTAYRLSAWARLVSGTGLLTVNVLEDDSADCGSITATTAVISAVVPGAAWLRQAGNITTGAGTIRVQVQVSLPAAAAQALDIDAIQLRAGIVPTDSYCDAPGAATGVCATSVTSHASALSANGSATIEGTWCTPWAGTDPAADATIWTSGNAAAANSLTMILESTTDEPAWYVYDSASATKYNEPNTANWAASTPYLIRNAWSGGGWLGLTWPSGTWYETAAGAGTGIRAAAQATTYICGSHAAGSDTWVTGETIYRGVLR
jgi:hypothetical protein